MLAAFLETATAARLLRWLGAGLLSMAASSAFLYAFVDLLGFPVPVATLFTAEACTLLRFLVNHYWVFGQRSPTWKHCLQYHVATAGAFVTWWTVSNVLVFLGVHYILAGLLAVPFSAIVNLLGSFLWVWRKQRLHH
jgi:dolichol-phosphate mannosyltransferase